ncbi:hypothetical protein CR513_05530, partial [Mucuna pruriens]
MYLKDQQAIDTAILATTTIENANLRQFTISRGPDEAISNQQPRVPTNYEFHWIQQTECHHKSVGSSNLPSQTIPNPRGNASVITLRSGKALLQPAPQQLPISTDADFEPEADSQALQQVVSAKKPDSDEELLRMFRKVEINIPLSNAIKQIPKYAKFLKELFIHKRKKMKGSVEVGGIVSALTRNKDSTTGAQALPKKCQDPRIFSIPCTIGDCTFVDAMLDLRSSINVMPTSIYKSLNFGDLEPTGMTIQLANRSVVQPLGILEDVLVQVNELIFPEDFYVLDMEDETSGKGFTLILERPFLMTARTKIDVHTKTLSMEFGDTLVHTPFEDHSLFGIDLIDELVEECLQLDNNSKDSKNFAGSIDSISCLGSRTVEADYDEVHDLPDFEDDNIDLADLSQEAELIKLLDQVRNHENLECSNNVEVQVVETEELFISQVATMFTTEYESAKRGRDQRRTEVISTKKTMVKANPHVEIMLAYLVPSSIQVSQLDSKLFNDNSSSPPSPMELKPLPSHGQEDKLLQALRQHKKAIGWKLSDLPRINPSIFMNRILMEEEAKPIRQQQRRMNLTILDVVKKEVTKLFAAGIIYPISDS